MQLALQRTLCLILSALILTLSFAGTTSAEDANVSTETETAATVDANTGSTNPLPLMRPALLQNLQNNAQDAIQNVRKNLNPLIQMKSSSTSDERKNIIEDFREKKAELNSERKTAIMNFKERMQALARTHLGATITRFSTLIRHFENIAERMESRIEKLKALGADTASVETSLETAVTLTTTAKADVEALKNLINEVTDSSDPETVKTAIRAAIGKATASVKAAHQAFIKAARELSALAKATIEINSETTVDRE